MGGTIKGVCLDGGYKTPAVCKVLLEDGMNVYMPYKRPMTKKDFSKNMNMYMMNIMTVTYVQIIK